MTDDEEKQMHEFAVQLEGLTRGTGWEAMRYFAIAVVMEKLAEFCPITVPTKLEVRG